MNRKTEMASRRYEELERKADKVAASPAAVVVLCGISGSGKTEFAKCLTRRGFHRLSVDQLLFETYGDSFRLLPFERQRELTLEAERKIAEEMLNEASGGKRVVVDGCMCKRFKRDFFRSKADEHGVALQLVYLHATLETTLARMRERKGNGVDDIIVDEERIRGFFQGFEKPASDEPHEEIVTD